MAIPSCTCSRNLPKDVTAVECAELYRKRWSIETLFYEVTQTLQCEIKTLGYPSAALFAFVWP